MSFLKSTIGKKVVVALTGLVLFGFVIGHLLGNLLVFAGPETYNHYSEAIKANLPLLWGARVVLLVSVFLHIFFTVQLTRANRQSRPIGYVAYEPQHANLPSRLMIWSGLLLGFYIVYHLLHLTTGTVHPHFQAHDVYSNLVEGLSIWYAALFYIAAMVSLGFHLYHGVWSIFQTLGLNHPKYNSCRRVFAVGTSIAISAGYISIPVGILTGVVR